MKTTSRTFAASIFGALLVAAVGWSLRTYPFGWPLISTSYETLLVARGEIAAPEAVIVYMDEVSHEKLNQPFNAAWDRTLHSRLIDRLTPPAAPAIVVDIIFSDQDLTRPAADHHSAKAIK